MIGLKVFVIQRKGKILILIRQKVIDGSIEDIGDRQQYTEEEKKIHGGRRTRKTHKYRTDGRCKVTEAGIRKQNHGNM